MAPRYFTSAVTQHKCYPLQHQSVKCRRYSPACFLADCVRNENRHVLSWAKSFLRRGVPAAPFAAVWQESFHAPRNRWTVKSTSLLKTQSLTEPFSRTPAAQLSDPETQKNIHQNRNAERFHFLCVFLSFFFFFYCELRDLLFPFFFK